MEERTALFGEEVVRFAKRIPRGPGNNRLIDQFVGAGPLITDDRPLPEYFLIRSILHPHDPIPYPDDLRRLTAP